MLQSSLAHLRGNVVAYLALFVALGGSSYAADLKGDPGAGRYRSSEPRQAPTGASGSGSIVLQARLSDSVSAPHGATTDVALTDGTWTQSAGDLNLLAGSVTMQIPAACTGSLGNSVVLSVDGTKQTFAIAPNDPASSTVTVPFVVGTLSEPNNDAKHRVTAQFVNSCTQSGEDFKVTGLKLDALRFR